MSSGFRFKGFTLPTFTQVPDQLFDELAPELSEAELRVLLYIVRRTFGFKKEADGISISQLVQGIRTKDGKVLDRGTGMSRPGVTKGVKGLVEKGVIEVTRTMDERGENHVNVYRLRFGSESEGVGNNVDYPSKPRYLGVGNAVDPQETVRQETVRQEQFEDSNGLDVKDDFPQTTIAAYLGDFARELHDQAPLPSSVGRAVNLYRESGWPLERFLKALYTARATTQQYSASIKAAPAGDGPWPAKPKMAYFFAVLEDVLELKERATG